MRINSYIFIIFLFFINNNLLASNTDLPKFMSIKVNEANLRAGPGTNFPIELIYITKNLVIEVIDSFDNWYKIIDEEGNKGWLHKSLISKRRYFVTDIDGAKLYKNPHNRNEFLLLELGLRGRINSCRKDWCNVKFREYSGWIQKSEIWGVYPDEDF